MPTLGGIRTSIENKSRASVFLEIRESNPAIEKDTNTVVTHFFHQMDDFFKSPGFGSKSSKLVDEAKYVLRPEEAHRFRAILGEAVERLSLLELMTADSSRKSANSKREPAAQNNVRNRKDIVTLMVKEKELERSFENLMHKRWTLKGLSNKTKYLKNEADLKEMKEMLRKQSKSIRQNLKEHPTTDGNLKKIQKDRKDLEDILGLTVDELTGMTFNVLVARVAERTADQKRLQETKKKAEKTANALAELEQKLDNEVEMFEKRSEDQNEEIAKLTAQLKHMKKVTRLKLSFEKETALAQAETKARLQNKEIAALKDQKERLEKALFRDGFVYSKSMDFLAKKAAFYEATQAKESEKKEKDEQKMERQLKELQERRDLDLTQLTGLRIRWDKETKRNKELADEAERRDKEIKAKQRLLGVMNLAQSKIRMWWQVHKETMKKKEKDAKKKKKKGGKKKKKKAADGDAPAEGGAGDAGAPVATEAAADAGGDEEKE